MKLPYPVPYDVVVPKHVEVPVPHEVCVTRDMPNEVVKVPVADGLLGQTMDDFSVPVPLEEIIIQGHLSGEVLWVDEAAGMSVVQGFGVEEVVKIVGEQRFCAPIENPTEKLETWGTKQTLSVFDACVRENLPIRMVGMIGGDLLPVTSPMSVDMAQGSVGEVFSDELGE